MIELLEAVKNFTKSTLDGISLDNRGGGTASPVFNAHTATLTRERQEPRAEDFPLIVVRLLDSVDENVDELTDPTIATVQIIIGVWSENMHAGGYIDICNCLTRMRHELLSSSVLAQKFKLTGKMEARPFEEFADPFWFGEIITRWEIQRSVPVIMPGDDWRGASYPGEVKNDKGVKI